MCCAFDFILNLNTFQQTLCVLVHRLRSLKSFYFSDVFHFDKKDRNSVDQGKRWSDYCACDSLGLRRPVRQQRLMLPLHNFTLQDFAKFGTILQCKICINFQCTILQFYYNLTLHDFAKLCKTLLCKAAQSCAKYLCQICTTLFCWNLHIFFQLQCIEFAIFCKLFNASFAPVKSAAFVKLCTTLPCEHMQTQCGHNMNTRRHSLTIKHKYTDKPSFAKSVQSDK